MPSELKAPTGKFLMVELRDNLDPRWVAVLFSHITQIDGVDSVCDLAFMPLAFLEDRILLRLDPNEVPTEYRGRPSYEAIRKYHARKRQPALL